MADNSVSNSTRPTSQCLTSKTWRWFGTPNGFAYCLGSRWLVHISLQVFWVRMDLDDTIYVDTALCGLRPSEETDGSRSKVGPGVANPVENSVLLVEAYIYGLTNFRFDCCSKGLTTLCEFLKSLILPVGRWIFGRTAGRVIFRTDWFFMAWRWLLRTRLLGGSGFTPPYFNAGGTYEIIADGTERSLLNWIVVSSRELSYAG